MYTEVLCTAASVAVDLVLLAAEDPRASQNAIGHGGVVLWSARARAGETLTYMGDVGGGGAAGGLAAGLGPAGAASPAGLLVVELQVFQALSQGQFLLDGHPQQGVEGLLLVLCCGQLPLHLLQLSDILVATAGESETERRRGSHETEECQRTVGHITPQGGTSSSSYT